MATLINGNMRFKELERSVSGITARMLSRELKNMELNGLINRTVYDSMPVCVESSLTPYSQSLEKVIEALYNWDKEHPAEIMAEHK